MTTLTIRPGTPARDARTTAGPRLTAPPNGRPHPGRGAGTAPRRGYTPTRVGAYAGRRAIQRAEG
jgi:hypothetical protein